MLNKRSIKKDQFNLRNQLENNPIDLFCRIKKGFFSLKNSPWQFFKIYLVN